MNLDELRVLSLIAKDNQFRACDRGGAERLAAQGFVALGRNLPRGMGDTDDRGASAAITDSGRKELMRLRAR